MKLLYLFILLFMGGIEYIYGVTLIHRPVQRGIIGVPTLVEASLDLPNEYLWANLYVKTATNSIYFRFPMTGTGSRFYVEIPQQYSVIEGTQYYIEVVLQDNSKVLFPSTAPNIPVTIRNESANTAADITIIDPSPGAIYKNGNKPKLVATTRGLEYFGGNEKIKVFFDNKLIDAKIQFGFIEYDLIATDISPGEHSFKIELYNQLQALVTKKNVTFIVKPLETTEEKLDSLEKALQEDESITAEDAKKQKDKEEEDEDNTWKSSGTIGGTYQFSRTQSQQPTSLAYPNGFYNLNAQFKTEKKGLSFYVGPLTWTSTNVEAGQRKNQYSFGLTKGPLSLALNGAGRLGVDINWNAAPNGEKKRGYSIRASANQSKIPVEKNVDPNKQGVYAQTSWSGGITFTPFDNILSVTSDVSYILDDRSSIQSASTLPVSKSLSTNSKVKFFIPSAYISFISFGYVLSHNNLETFVLAPNGKIESIKNTSIGNSVNAQTGGTIKEIRTNYTFNLQVSAPTFQTNGTKGGSDNLSTNSTLTHSGLIRGKVQLNENFTYSRDNLSKQKATTTSTYAVGVTLGITIGGYWPGFNFSNQVNYQMNTGDPKRELRQITNSFTANTSYTIPIKTKSINVTFGYSRTDSIDKSTPVPGNQLVASSYSPSINSQVAPWLSISASYSYSVDSSVGKQQVNNNSSTNLSLSFSAFAGKLSIPVSLGHTRSSNNLVPSTVDTNTLNYTLGISGRYEKHNLSLTGSASQLINRLNTSANYFQYSLTVSYGLSL